MAELADELPGHTPRFVLLSYPLTLVSYSRAHIYIVFVFPYSVGVMIAA